MTKNCTAISSRAHRNVTPRPGIDFLRLHQWYNQQNVVGPKEVYLKVPAGIKNGKGSTFMLELFIHGDMVYVDIILPTLALC
jgi:hypothetical protein